MGVAMWVFIVLIIAATIFLVAIFIVWLSKLKKLIHKKPSSLENEDDSLFGPDETAASFGEKGEIYVHSCLEEVKKRYGGYLYHDFCFEDENGYSSEIDHILITRGGIFIIETKSNKGTIRGNENDELWRSLKENSPAWKYFKNPIQQNWGHIYHLRNTIKPNPPKMVCMVIFPFADVSQIESSCVYSLDGAIHAIEEATSSQKYTTEFVERVNHQICSLHQISKEQHRRNIEEYDDSTM